MICCVLYRRLYIDFNINTRIIFDMGIIEKNAVLGMVIELVVVSKICFVDASINTQKNTVSKKKHNIISKHCST